MSSAKYTISALPLAAKEQLLIHRLTPDPHVADVPTFKSSVLRAAPSLQRRSRILHSSAHFSYVTPFPIEFPYNVLPPDPPPEDKAAYIEKWLSEREALHQQPAPAGYPNATLRKFYSKNREETLDLIGLSETCLRDCVPHLDVGDGFAILGAPSLSGEFGEEGDPAPSNDQRAVEARQDLVDILSGYATLMSPDEGSDVQFAPWSMRYSGHQFGSWAGQLGDGRAVSILTTPHPKDSTQTYELQLKGCGRTPFSRTADGLAVLRSSIREYLCSEAMHALNIPTTRALSIVSLPKLSVQREKTEFASVVTRIAPSFIRIGNFEALNGPTNMFFFGGGQQKPDYDALRVLGEWTAESVLKLPIEKGRAWGKELVLEVARRNGKMVAGWQAYGFMHGVINTDNVSILGLTIDFGPYAFMDVFDPLHICNHSDESGRYAYKFQPNMIVYAIRSLLHALAPLIGAESELGGKAVSEGWAKDASKEKIDEWTAKGLELKDEIERVVQQNAADEYGRLMRLRLGLRRQDPTDESNITKPLLSLLEDHQLDFHSTFRKLSTFTPSIISAFESTDSAESADASVRLAIFITELLNGTPYPERIVSRVDTAHAEWTAWLKKYAARIDSEKGLWKNDSVPVNDAPASVDAEREKEMKSVNPRFVLRQWLLEEVIKKVEEDSKTGKQVLAKVFQMATNPFENWGAEEDTGPGEELTQEEKEERRFCGLGEKKLLGFQCSCSS